MLKLVTTLTLFGPPEGGLEKPVLNGLRPSFNYDGQRVACEVWAEEVDEFVPLSQPLRVRIRLPYGEELGWKFVGGEAFRLNIASRVIGEGVVAAPK